MPKAAPSVSNEPLSASVSAVFRTHAPTLDERAHGALTEALLSQLMPFVEREVSARLTDAEQRREAEIEARIQEEVARRVATEVARKVQELMAEARLARYRLFGRRSEAHPGQGELFNEAEVAAAPSDVASDAPSDVADAVPPARRPARGKRRPLPPALPRVEVIVEVPEAERHCACGQAMIRIGEEVSEQLDIIPMRIQVRRTIRPRYACPQGDTAPVTAPVPPTPLPRSLLSAGALAMLLTVKYVDGLPLHRFAKVLARHGVEIPRQTLARAVIQSAAVLQPLHNLLRDTLLSAPMLHMDETPIQVLKEPGRTPQAKSYMWVQRGGPPGQPVVLYDYAPSRSGAVPKALLEGWQGYLMVDGYQGYAAVGEREGVELLACMVHARRKFHEAKKAAPKGKAPQADIALKYFAQLYRIEQAFKEADHATRGEARQRQSLPVLNALREWLDRTRPTVSPKGRLGQALAYLDQYWPRLVRYTERGDLPIDNNPAENAIRPFVVGRRAWLFADTPAGAHASAVIYSLIETAKANDLEPYAWLKRVLAYLPAARTVEDMEALLPWNLHNQDLLIELTD